MSTDPIRVLIADDSAPFRQGLRDLLRSVDGVTIIGEAATGDEAVVRAADSQPDVVLMDLRMPVLNGIDGARRILATSPHIAVLMLTMFEDDESVLAAMRVGAKGYILKGASRTEIVRALQIATDGGLVFGPGVARRVLEHFSIDRSESTPFPQLSTREREILSLMADGVGNTDIAVRLSLSPKTVRNHVYALYRKLQVHGRAEAIVQARDAGLGTPRPPTSRREEP
jgi:DNA-binding NarL/FixJ family response regulator